MRSGVCKLQLNGLAFELAIILKNNTKNKRKKNAVKNRVFSYTVRMVKKWRRALHERAETGFDLEKTISYIREQLQGMGYVPKPCGKAGIVATVGSEKERCVLLRADVDALPMRENTGLPFACKHGNMHACGHDMHGAMLLGAAQILKEREMELNGCVKLLFQPAEEILEGASDCIRAGVLTEPKPQAAFALHVSTGGDLPTGTIVLSSREISAPAADYFEITVTGKSCHGATPEKGIDALNAAAHILLALQTLSSREQAVENPFVLTVGKMQAGSAGNAIAETAQMQGTLRAYDEKTRAQIKNRLKEIVSAQAKAFGARGRVRFLGGCPTLKNDLTLVEFAETEIQKLFGENAVVKTDGRGGGSEDFAYFSHELPSLLLVMGAGEKKEGYEYPLHHSKTDFDENALVVGSKLLAHLAEQTLKKG